MAKTQSRGRVRTFRVGDRVQFRFVTRDLIGRITEDRGLLAAGRQHLYRVLVDYEDARRELELPADQLRLVAV